MTFHSLVRILPRVTLPHLSLGICLFVTHLIAYSSLGVDELTTNLKYSSGEKRTGTGREKAAGKRRGREGGRYIPRNLLGMRRQIDAVFIGGGVLCHVGC